MFFRLNFLKRNHQANFLLSRAVILNKKSNDSPNGTGLRHVANKTKNEESKQNYAHTKILPTTDQLHNNESHKSSSNKLANLMNCLNLNEFNTYEEELATRRRQANHSIFFSSVSLKPRVLDELIDDLLCTGSKIEQIFLQTVSTSDNKVRYYVLVEFKTRRCVDNVLKNYTSHFDESQENSTSVSSRIILYSKGGKNSKALYFS